MTRRAVLQSVVEAHANAWRLSEHDGLPPGTELRSVFIPDETFPFAGFRVDPAERCLVTFFSVGGRLLWPEPVAAKRIAVRSNAYAEIPAGTSIVIAVKHDSPLSMPVRVWLYSARDWTDDVPLH